LNTKGWAIWITGLPASGKSTLARHLKKKLLEMERNTQILESDTLRRVFTPEPTYTPKERDHFYNVLIYVGKLLSDNGINVIFDATANKRVWRNAARNDIKDFMEVYLTCPLVTCRDRDNKGIYRMAERGEAFTVPGIQVRYEEPLDPELVLDCVEDPYILVQKILVEMEIRGYI
jgi:adenylylsulfate kinase